MSLVSPQYGLHPLQGHYQKVAFLTKGVAKYGDEATEIARRLGLSRFFSGEIAEEAIEKGLRSFSEDSFRENLRRLTGKAVEEIGDLEAHHVLPQEFIEKFQRAGLDIHDPTFGAWVDKNLHRHWSSDYNREWRRFFDQFDRTDTAPSPEQILEFARGLAREYRFDVHFTLD
ncbi:MAG: DUF2380 domain-containing protein [Chloroflexi bacterium]|nr:DUF2380 domain-containing protein [Chloroflexota bacterium]